MRTNWGETGNEQIVSLSIYLLNEYKDFSIRIIMTEQSWCTYDVREDSLGIVSKAFRYGDPVFIFLETIQQRLKRNDRTYVGMLNEDILRSTYFWRVLITYRTLIAHSVISSNRSEIEMAVSNIYQLLKVFQINLYVKAEIRDILGNCKDKIYVASDYIDMDVSPEGVEEMHCCELFDEYESYQTGQYQEANDMRKLFAFFGFICERCVARRGEYDWTRRTRVFKDFDVNSPVNSLPNIPFAEYAEEDSIYEV